ncbi:MAG: tyrosine-type recombinase/integrase [Planctomycetota bacterium]
MNDDSTSPDSPKMPPYAMNSHEQEHGGPAELSALGPSQGEDSRVTTTPKGKAAKAALQRVDSKSAVALLAQVPAEDVWLEGLDSERTRRAYKSDVRQFVEFLGMRSRDELYAVTPAAVIAWRRHLEVAKGDGGLGLKRATVRRKLSALSSLYEHLVEEALVDFNPVGQVKRPRRTTKDRKGRTAPLLQDEARLLLNAPPLTRKVRRQGRELEEPLEGDALVRSLRDRALLSLGFQNGLRRSEIAHLTVGSIEVRERLPHLTYIAKGGEEHTVPMNPQAHKRVMDYLEAAGHGDDFDSPLLRPTRSNHVEGTDDMNRHLDPDMVDRIVRRWAKEALGRTRGISAHTMRSTFVTRTLENGCPLERVQNDVGHAHISTTQLYDHRGLSPEEAAPFFANY